MSGSERRGTGRTVDTSALELARVIAGIADAEHGSNVIVLEVGDVLGVTEYFVIVSASNRRLVHTLVEEIEVQTRDQIGRSPLRSEGVRENQWVLVDYGDVVVHVFLAEIRDFYEIERLYTDVPKIDWSDAASA
jgi:ribosome-associated protein